MAGKRRSGLANDRRAYGCGRCYIPFEPTPTILVYDTDKGTSFAWSGITFTRNTNLPNFSYTATITSIPSSQVPYPTNLIGVTFGNIVTSIGFNAFVGCTSLANVIFTPTSSLGSIGISAFYGCTALTSITIPSSVTSLEAAF